jgi:cell division protease FtsH
MAETDRNTAPETKRRATPPAPESRDKFTWGDALSLLAWLALLAVIVYVWIPGNRLSQQAPVTVPISDAADRVRNGQVARIVADGDGLRLELRNGTTVLSRKESWASVPDTLRQYQVPDERIAEVTVEVKRPTDWGWALSLVWLLPLLLVLALFLRRSSVPGGDAATSFVRSRARKVSAELPPARFDDVAGVDEAKQELAEIVEFLREPARFLALGARIPRGVLIAGPPGTGKTLLARAVAGEAGVPFFSINASEFVELFVGVGAGRVRDLFREAREQAPAIIFIDEIDAIGRRRGAGLTQSHEEREQTLNQILAELDGFDPRANVVVMAATNRPDILDPALLRPGRFDRRVTVEAPDRDGRLAILRVHARGKPLAPDVDLGEVARSTVGFSGADLENLLNEGALLAARRGKSSIGREELEEAAERVMAGPRRRGRGLTPAEQELAAYHEAGHALVAHRLPHADPVHRVSIVARGPAGGHTRLLPEEDRRFWTRSQLADTLAFALGGLTAEEMVFGEPTTGPGSDLEHASELARRMVVEYGMSERLGPVALGHPFEPDAAALLEARAYSEQTAATVDAEVQRLLREAHERARATLAPELAVLDQLAAQLLERETLHREDLDALLGPPAGPGRGLTRRVRTEIAPGSMVATLMAPG